MAGSLKWIRKRRSILIALSEAELYSAGKDLPGYEIPGRVSEEMKVEVESEETVRRMKEKQLRIKDLRY
ncbi:hypothetical protein ES705_47447 [subsurface metagenome]